MYKPRKSKSLYIILSMISVFSLVIMLTTTIGIRLSTSIASAADRSFERAKPNFFTATASEQIDKAVAPAKLQRFAEQTANQLSRLSTFSSWVGADIVVEPLGPGTHSWLASVLQDKENHATFVGYMVFSVNPANQYVLVEYGAGEDSIYHPDRLSEALSLLGLSTRDISAKPYYGGPLWTEWSLSNGQFIHAGTGEVVPQSKTSWNVIQHKYSAPTGSINTAKNDDFGPLPIVFTGDDFDPYEQITWMIAKPLQLQTSSFLQALDSHKQLIFVGAEAEGNGTYRIPFPVTGYQKWDANVIYVQAGTITSPRFVALDSLLPAGHFVTNSFEAK
ncbi:hypothetical protein ABE099_04810 [Paenibacillus turicensis]|uniref:hypothetical protein n=1 Tax=Paenibacillus turicensis TaxID=160487 RepID=UPI003D2B12B5